MVKTIRGKVTLWSIIIVGILNIILSVFIYVTINKKLESSIQGHMKTIQFMARNIAMTSGSPNEEDDIIVSNLYNIFGDYIAIAYKDNKVISSKGNFVREDKIIELLEESNSRKSLLNLNKDSKLYIATFNYPIYIDESYYGNIVIQKDYTKEYNENYKIICSIFIGQFIILSILVMALWSIISKFTKPINNLSNAIENFAIGKDEGDIKIETKDEVAILADKFNFMKNEIKYQMEVIIKEQNKSREFFNNVTHELKTPITAISGYTQLLIDNDISEIEEEFRERSLERILKESNKLNSLVKNILEISRGKVKRNIDKEEFDFGDLINKKISDMKVRFVKSNLYLKTNINNTIVKCNKEEISTIIINLLDNAIKYTAGKEIIVNVYEESEKSIFEISNKIYEIPENIKNNLLEAFVKHTNDIILEKEGITSSGLGLYICSKLAEENNSELIYDIKNNIIIV
ncbi:MAG: HAMP domain-containing sensor histidine kinase, partial [Clostridium celatum]|nr:HAMP domain-containing sensor histidine kinase [Clostridium celatum]